MIVRKLTSQLKHLKTFINDLEVKNKSLSAELENTGNIMYFYHLL